MKKRMLSLLLALVMVLVLVPTVALAEDTPAMFGTCGASGNENNVKWELTDVDGDGNYTLTISGTGKYLKEASNGAVKVIGSDPEGSIYSASSRDEVHQYDIEGVGEDFYPKAFDRNITDDIVRVGDAEAFEMTRRLAGEEGLLVGGSSGMAVASAIKYALANDLDENQIVVVLAPDSGRSYLEKIFDDDWMRANGYGDVVDRTTKPSLAEQYL